MSCTCQPDSIRPPAYPRKPDCLRCGKRARPPAEAKPLKFHCARCLNDLVEGQRQGMLYLVAEGGRVEESKRFCPTCTMHLFEVGISFQSSEQVQATHLGVP